MSYGQFNPNTDLPPPDGGGGSGRPQKPARREMGRGVLDGVRKDIKVGARCAGRRCACV